MFDFSDRPTIWITGYPRSGTTWVCRSLAQALDCPSLSWSEKEDAKFNDPVIEGVRRDGSEYVVRRSHFSKPFYDNHDLGPYDAIVMPVRDPRDVAISAWRHFTFPKTQAGLRKAVAQLVGLENGLPLQPMVWGGYNEDHTPPGRPGWPGFVGSWLDAGIPVTRFEDHLENPVKELTRLIGEIGLRVKPSKVKEAATDNIFANRPKDFLMRKGIAGEWREHMSKRQALIIWKHCKDVMKRLGYDRGV